jgi:Holliday junction resolvase RusA-like endonuclease
VIEHPDLILAVRVPGLPRTKGSLGKGFQDTPQSKAWRRVVAMSVRGAAAAVGGVTKINRPVQVRCAFHLPGDPVAHGAGDIDKLERNVLDALGCTRPDDAHLIADDNLVTQLIGIKVGPSQWVGLDLEVREVQT